MDAEVVGRERELAALTAFVEGVGQPPTAVLLEGEAGIGKTSLLRAAVAVAGDRGHRVLACRPAESEAKLAFAALIDLLGDAFAEVADQLPSVQRQALAVAMLREEPRGTPPDRSVIGVGFLAVVRALAERAPVLIAVDDVQWIDPSSAAVLAFATRRLYGLPVGVLVTRRTTAKELPAALARALAEAGLQRIDLGPLSIGALQLVLRSRMTKAIPRPLLRRIHQASAGNPLFALEIAAALDGSEAPPADGGLPVPKDLLRLLGARIDSLSPDAREVLLIAAAASRPTEELVASVSGPVPDVADVLARAERAGVLRLGGGRVRFTHPLLASTVYEAASDEGRRRAHARLAEHVEDPEERARHLALAASGPDEGVAEALDQASQLARARGAPEVAAELSALARRMTPLDHTDAIRSRTVQTAQHSFAAGDVARSNELFDEAIEAAPPGSARARILFTCASHAWMDLRRVGTLCAQALREAEGDADLMMEANEHLAWVAIYHGDLEAAAHHATTALRHAHASASLASRAEAQATFGTVEFLRGRLSPAVMAEADRLQDLGIEEELGRGRTSYTSAKTNHAVQLLWAGELDAAREIIEQELRMYERVGLYLVREEVVGYMAEVECRAGNLERAARFADEAYEMDVEAGHLSGRGRNLYLKALVAAHRGDMDDAIAAAEEGLRDSIVNDDAYNASGNRAVLGFVELSRSQHAAAIEHLAPVLEYLTTMDAAEPGVVPAVPDAIECLVALGRLDEAERVLGDHERKARQTGRPWALATAGRCRGLVLAARGAAPEALEALDRAVEAHAGAGQPMELGRTLLAKGVVARRAKQKRTARDALGRAVAIFDEIGARAWARTARAERSRIGGRPPSPGGLTPSELRIAELVSQGGSNKEVAAALFVSVRTVETNLSRIYAKLGVRSRTALASRLHAGGIPVANSDPQSKS
jgi:DNA-binding CsgD family transcriptional regulator